MSFTCYWFNFTYRMCAQILDLKTLLSALLAYFPFKIKFSYLQELFVAVSMFLRFCFIQSLRSRFLAVVVAAELPASAKLSVSTIADLKFFLTFMLGFVILRSPYLPLVRFDFYLGGSIGSEGSFCADSWVGYGDAKVPTSAGCCPDFFSCGWRPWPFFIVYVASEHGSVAPFYPPCENMFSQPKVFSNESSIIPDLCRSDISDTHSSRSVVSKSQSCQQVFKVIFGFDF